MLASARDNSCNRLFRHSPGPRRTQSAWPPKSCTALHFFSRYSVSMFTSRGNPTFDPHRSARAGALSGIPLATFRHRAIAMLIDVVLVASVWLPAKMGLQYLIQQKLQIHEEIYHSTNGHTTTDVKFDLERTLELASTVWLVVYFGFFIRVTNGLTPGKRLMRIRVVSLEHERISSWQAIERALGYGASALEGGFGFIQYFLYKNHTCVHDRIAETIVVKDVKRQAFAAHEKPDHKRPNSPPSESPAASPTAASAASNPTHSPHPTSPAPDRRVPQETAHPHPPPPPPAPAEE
jgi:uncharacterized RDD family membrane protein YckC